MVAGAPPAMNQLEGVPGEAQSELNTCEAELGHVSPAERGALNALVTAASRYQQLVAECSAVGSVAKELVGAWVQADDLVRTLAHARSELIVFDAVAVYPAAAIHLATTELALGRSPDCVLSRQRG